MRTTILSTALCVALSALASSQAHAGEAAQPRSMTLFGTTICTADAPVDADCDIRLAPPPNVLERARLQAMRLASSDEATPAPAAAKSELWSRIEDALATLSTAGDQRTARGQR